MKLRKRNASWVLLLALVLLVVLNAYASIYALLLSPSGSSGNGGEAAQTIGELNPEVFLALSPEKMPVNVLLAVSRFGGVVALVFGALTFGSEYNWGTLKTVLSRRPGKLKVFAGKVLAMLAYFAVFSIVAFVVGSLCSYFIAGLEQMSIQWPGVWKMVKAFAAGWLIFAVWGVLGAFLATILRSASLAIGIGLGYAVILENLVNNLPTSGDDLQPLFASLLGKNAADLARSFGSLPEYFFQPSAGEAIQPAQATAVLGTYIIVLTLITTLLFWRRDVT